MKSNESKSGGVIVTSLLIVFGFALIGLLLCAAVVLSPAFIAYYLIKSIFDYKHEKLDAQHPRKRPEKESIVGDVIKTFLKKP